MIHFMIGCFSGINTGKGGHYYSLLHLRSAMSIPSKIVVIGDFFPPVYAGIDGIIFIRCSRIGLSFLSDYTRKISEQPSIIHSFDLNTALYGSRVARRNNIPFVITKPGGPVQRAHYATYRNQVVFHSEDFQYFKSLHRGPERISMIPQRVIPVSKETSRPDPFSGVAGANDIKIICISRIGPYYKRKLNQAVNLFEKIGEERSCALAIIGTIEDNIVMSDLSRSLAGKKAIIHTKDTYTHNAAELLRYADVSVAGGRSFMEALSLGMYVFFPVRDSDIPCFAEPTNIAEAMAQNFSERVQLSQIINPEAGLEKFLKRAEDESYRTEYSCWAKQKFDENFNVKTGAKIHEEFYSDVVYPERRLTVEYNRIMIQVSVLLQALRGFTRAWVR